MPPAALFTSRHIPTSTDWRRTNNTLRFIAFRCTFRMKHTNVSPVVPGPPTSREVTLQGCGVVHIKDDKIIEEWAYSDFLGFLQQLGVLPPLG